MFGLSRKQKLKEEPATLQECASWTAKAPAITGREIERLVFEG
jgi:hypothetical protein